MKQLQILIYIYIYENISNKIINTNAQYIIIIDDLKNKK